MHAQQVKILFVGNDFVGDVPLFKKILAALITGQLHLVSIPLVDP